MANPSVRPVGRSACVFDSLLAASIRRAGLCLADDRVDVEPQPLPLLRQSSLPQIPNLEIAVASAMCRRRCIDARETHLPRKSQCAVKAFAREDEMNAATSLGRKLQQQNQAVFCCSSS